MIPVIKIMRGAERTLVDSIYEGCYELEQATGRKPTRVHLGPEKAEAFQELASEILASACITDNWKHGQKPKHVARYNGLEIYRQIRPGMVIE